MENILNKSKTYKFNEEGLNKAIKDYKNDKLNNATLIGFWTMMGLLGIYGCVGVDSIYKMAVGSTTSKVVKMLIK